MEEFLTVEDISKTLKVSPVWIYKLVRQKRIPFFRVEKCVRFLPSEIGKWLEGGRNREWHRDKIRRPLDGGTRTRV
ncbi:MAG: helix-turn-helix domain-containing protein [Thermodesulfobacteriota bacterium]|jgi:excisionase family DNA binding protein